MCRQMKKELKTYQSCRLIKSVKKGLIILMKPVVYADILFCINFAANFLLLWTTDKVCRANGTAGRLILGAGVGALYAVFMFFPSLTLFYSLVAKLLFSVALISITFHAGTLKQFFRLILSFYLVNFAFAGALFAAVYYTDIGYQLGAVVSNGVFYFNLSIKTLLISSLVAYILIRVGFKIAEKRNSLAQNRLGICIGLGDKSVEMDALVDTGNSLSEPLSQLPVVVVERGCLKELLPLWLCDELGNLSHDDMELYSRVMGGEQRELRLRLIPFSSLGKQNGMLVGFKPDYITLTDEGKTYTEVIVGIYNSRLSKNNDYNALLHPALIR